MKSLTDIDIVDDELWNTKRVAEILGIREGTVRLWASQGRIPVLKFGGKCLRFWKSDVLRFLDRGQRWKSTDVVGAETNKARPEDSGHALLAPSNHEEGMT